MLFSTIRARPALPMILAASWCALPAFGGELLGTAGIRSLPRLAQNEVLTPRLTPAGVPQPSTALASAAASMPDPAAESASTARPAASQSLTVNLINRLVERGILAKDDAAELMLQAEADTAEARARDGAAQRDAIRFAVTEALSSAQAGSFTPDPALLPPREDEDTVRVTYIPESVKAELREQIKHDVMAKARDERWAAPRLMPEWALRIKLFGDVRVRYDGTFFPKGNDNTGAFPNFNAINTGAPFDIAGTNFSPQLNVDQDRHRVRLRVRLGFEADLGNGFSAGLRIATGETNTPTSTNQSLGLANQGQGGNFSKYAIWLDRGFLKYDLRPNASSSVSLTVGRFDNPFFRTSEIIWDDDLGFDGVAVQGQYEVAKGFTSYFAAGAFPVFNTDFNFSSNQPEKFKSSDKWLYGGQLGANWNIRKDLSFTFGAAYYHFDNAEGQLSDPYIPLSADDAGNTDNTRPSFAQKGNTYRPLRRIIPSPLNNFGTSNQFQYFGLAAPFHELHLAGKLDYNRWEPFQLSLYGEWAKNLAFDADRVNEFAVNNRGPSSFSGNLGSFAGGDEAWLIGFRAGSAALQKRGDWQVGVNYRYVESDAVVDAFTDSDFGLGGTNLEGFTLSGALALSPNISVTLRWMTSDQVAGPPLRNDVILLDFNAKF
jgi:hypothetical protein